MQAKPVHARERAHEDEERIKPGLCLTAKKRDWKTLRGGNIIRGCAGNARRLCRKMKPIRG
jgi:hypothetical protein